MLRLSQARRSYVAIIVATTLLAAACTGSVSTPGASATSGTSAAATSGPTYGGTVTMPIVADPTLNPYNPGASVESVFINRVLFEGLTKPGRDLAPAPDLALSWETSPDGLSWTFKLRSDVRWSDGKPFSPADVVFTFNDIVLNRSLPSGTNRAYFNEVKRVVAVDADSVRFELSQPFAALSSYLAYNVGILPKHVLSADPLNTTSFNKGTPVSTGPYKVEKFTAGESVVLVRNENYFGPKPYLDRIVYKVIPDANTQIAQALSGELDIMILANKSAVDRLKTAPNIVVAGRPLTQFYYLTLNQADPRFTDVRVRQAFAMAIDRPALIQSVEAGYATVGNSPIGPALKAYYDPSLSARYPFDPAQAKALLAEVGWKPGSDGVLVKDGKPFRFTLDVAKTTNIEPLNTLIQQYLKQIGISTDLNVMEYNALIQKVVVRRDYTATAAWWNMPSDPDVSPYFHSSAAVKGNNLPGYKDPKLDELLGQGQVARNLEERKAAYLRLQSYMADVLPYVFLYFPQEVDVLKSSLRGVPELGLRDSVHYIGEWWLEKK